MSVGLLGLYIQGHYLEIPSSSHYYTSELEQNYISPSRIGLVNWDNRKGNVFDYL